MRPYSRLWARNRGLPVAEASANRLRYARSLLLERCLVNEETEAPRGECPPQRLPALPQPPAFLGSEGGRAHVLLWLPEGPGRAGRCEPPCP